MNTNLTRRKVRKDEDRNVQSQSATGDNHRLTINRQVCGRYSDGLVPGKVASRIISPGFRMGLMIVVPSLPRRRGFTQPVCPLSVLDVRVAEDGVGTATVPRDE